MRHNPACVVQCMRLSCCGDDSEAEVLYVDGKEEGCGGEVICMSVQFTKSTIGGEMISLGYFQERSRT